MIGLFLEAINAPAPGWPGRRRYIAGQLWRMAVELVVFLLLIASFSGLIWLVYAAMNIPADV